MASSEGRSSDPPRPPFTEESRRPDHCHHRSHSDQNSDSDDSVECLSPPSSPEAGFGRGKEWKQRPLSIMWCIANFEHEENDTTQGIVYQDRAVIRGGHPSDDSAPEEDPSPGDPSPADPSATGASATGTSATDPSPSRSRKLKRRGRKKPRRSPSDTFDSDFSIDSSPESYRKERKGKTGEKFQFKNKRAVSREQANK